MKFNLLFLLMVFILSPESYAMFSVTLSPKGVRLAVPQHLNDSMMVKAHKIAEYQRRFLNNPYELLQDNLEIHRLLSSSFDKIKKREFTLNCKQHDWQQAADKPNENEIDQFNAELGARRDDMKELIDAMLHFHQSNPIFMLSECIGEACVLRRLSHQEICPRHRLLRQIMERVTITDKARNIIFYASGHCYFELELMLNLVEAGFVIDKIVIIEPLFMPALKGFAISPTASFDEIAQSFALVTFERTFVLAQLLYFMHGIGRPIEMLVYQNYLDFLDEKNFDNNKADLLIAMDYFEYDAFDYRREHLDEIFKNKLADDGVMFSAKVVLKNSLVVPEYSYRQKKILARTQKLNE